jgi:hypothetical protein
MEHMPATLGMLMRRHCQQTAPRYALKPCFHSFGISKSHHVIFTLIAVATRAAQSRALALHEWDSSKPDPEPDPEPDESEVDDEEGELVSVGRI